MSVPNWRRNEQLFAARTKTTQTIGTFVRDDSGRAVVNVGEGSITIRYATRYKPRKGDGVLLQFFGNTCRLLGPTAAKSKLGKVTAVDYPYLTITCDGKTYRRMPYTVSYSESGPKVGDTVSIDWDGGYVIDQVTAEPDEDEPPALTTGQKSFSKTFYAKQSGSFRTASHRWNSVRGDLLCDSKHSAGWFYGDTIRRYLDDDAHIDRVEVFLSLRSKKGDRPKIGRHSDKAEQSDGVSVYDGVTRPWSGWVTLPVEWAEGWRDTAGGVSVSGGESVYRGIGTDRQSGAIRIRGRQ